MPIRQGIPKLHPMDSQLTEYVPVLILALVAISFAGGTLVLSDLIGRWANKNRLKQVARTKNIPYECGMLPVGEGSTRLSVKFYLVAMLFILFDVEAAFLYPWALTLRDGGRTLFVFGEMAVFMGILVLGYVYVWRRGALEWD